MSSYFARVQSYRWVMINMPVLLCAHSARGRIFSRQGRQAEAASAFEAARSITGCFQYHGFELVVLREEVAWTAVGPSKTAATHRLKDRLQQLGVTAFDLDYIQF